MHVNVYGRLFDEAFRLRDTVLGGAQGQRRRGPGHDGQADRGGGTTIQDAPDNAAAINFLHRLFLRKTWRQDRRLFCVTASPARARAGDQINLRKLGLVPADQRPGQIIFQRPNTPRRQKQLG
jgi:hypothetical protein